MFGILSSTHSVKIINCSSMGFWQFWWDFSLSLVVLFSSVAHYAPKHRRSTISRNLLFVSKLVKSLVWPPYSLSIICRPDGQTVARPLLCSLRILSSWSPAQIFVNVLKHITRKWNRWNSSEGTVLHNTINSSYAYEMADHTAWIGFVCTMHLKATSLHWTEQAPLWPLRYQTSWVDQSNGVRVYSIHSCSFSKKGRRVQHSKQPKASALKFGYLAFAGRRISRLFVKKTFFSGFSSDIKWGYTTPESYPARFTRSARAQKAKLFELQNNFILLFHFNLDFHHRKSLPRVNCS